MRWLGFTLVVLLAAGSSALANNQTLPGLAARHTETRDHQQKVVQQADKATPRTVARPTTRVLPQKATHKRLGKRIGSALRSGAKQFRGKAPIAKASCVLVKLCEALVPKTTARVKTVVSNKMLRKISKEEVDVGDLVGSGTPLSEVDVKTLMQHEMTRPYSTRWEEFVRRIHLLNIDWVNNAITKENVVVTKNGDLRLVDWSAARKTRRDNFDNDKRALVEVKAELDKKLNEG